MRELQHLLLPLLEHAYEASGFNGPRRSPRGTVAGSETRAEALIRTSAFRLRLAALSASASPRLAPEIQAYRRLLGGAKLATHWEWARYAR